MIGWLSLGLKILPLIIGAVHGVEKLKTAAKGKEKQDAAVEMVNAMLMTVEAAVAKDLVDNDEFNKLTRKLIDDYVAVQNFIAGFKSKL